MSKGLKRIKVALIGSRGIPPQYGGAETFVYELSKKLKKFFTIFVTCETDKFNFEYFEGIIRIHIPAKHTSTMTIPVLYDILATIYLLKKAKDIDIIYYVAPDGAYAALLAKIARKKVLINVDGREWKRLLIRKNYVPLFQKPLYLMTALFLIIAEFLAAKIPDIAIADSLAVLYEIQRLWKPRRMKYIPYGIRELPRVPEEEQLEILRKMNLQPLAYYLTVGRIVPENGIHVEIEAFKKTSSTRKLVIVGSLNSKDSYAKYLYKLANNDRRIIFTGPIYDVKILGTLRKNCKAYIHPYTVGGTNPSLLEQMQYGRPIIASDTPYHQEILGSNGIYFRTKEDLTKILQMLDENDSSFSNSRHYLMKKAYDWECVTKKYKDLILSI
jgi:glycosyltransferase involved in cell wall biosynthesis